ncbi:MAG: AAC(3) family N-acetyltransferase [Ktedonobacteraceae bacterium]|nr:AAC(3) family N-acetyltransferase [Ktedonobacteraceae bacterium]
MSEGQIVQETPSPRTRESLAHDLRELGILPRMTVMVHSSLRSLGWVSGGPVAVVQALMDVVTLEGTIVMPTQTGGYSNPATWQAPPVPKEWWPIIYQTMPAFDPLVIPTEHMGKIVEVFRTWPGVLRSSHPIVSFAAWGEHAEYIIKDHALDYGLGEGSPLARIYDLDGWIVMVGTGYDTNTSLHLAEYRAPGRIEVVQGSPIYEKGARVWKMYRDIEIDSDIFPEIGAELEQTGLVKISQVGSATTRLLPQRAAVDFALQWFTNKLR